MIEKIKKHPYLCLISLISLLVGLFLIFGDESLIKSIIFQLIGIGLILVSILKLVKNKQENNLTKVDVINNAIMILIGVLVMFNVDILLIICAIIILIQPIINIVKSNNKKQQAMYEIVNLVIGIVLILLCFDFIYKIIFTIIGVVLIGLSGLIIYLVLSGMIKIVSIDPLKMNEKESKDDVIDV